MLFSRKGCNVQLMTCRDCQEMAWHCHQILVRRSKCLGIRVVDGGLPFLRKGSPLNWFPTLDVVCMFPISEDGVFDLHCEVFRPLFYIEINASSYVVLKARWRVVKGGFLP